MNHPNAVPGTRDVSIAQIETAINVWRNRNPAISDEEVMVLCAEARCLATLYGDMIFTRASVVPRETLTEAQLAALAGAQA
ncbi:hypothetical protein BTH42_34145 [Burkholderia sp. SRS-W-2-2016]|uniref:DUF3717 domain-containing protein n=1 Tax=Burkholderia sp. SRS-W-2-2016 TaxID=1926878 RepID=UPI00094B5543|nr:DUF3717 domain-containing protein [Burkholderia sp. SRS-W-2-2016]OLL27206.1 hypothetical protein BTH42_34145 [Burkholderia sp. SRS-W-2-2016]